MKNTLLKIPQWSFLASWARIPMYTHTQHTHTCCVFNKKHLALFNNPFLSTGHLNFNIGIKVDYELTIRSIVPCIVIGWRSVAELDSSDFS